MHAPELRDRIIPIVGKHFCVQLLSALDADCAFADGAGLHVLGKLVEKQPAQRLCRTRVARKQCAFHGFGQVRQREHGAVEIGEIRGKRASFVWREFGHGVRYTSRAKAGH